MSQKYGDFQEDNFEQKLLGLKDTQDSIQTLSAWCLKYQQQHKKVVGCWLHVLRKVKVEQRVTLFYLANDVIQYSKRRNYPFVESWATALQKATPLVRDDKVKHKILRLFKIWAERNIYDEAFLSDLCGLLTAHTKKNAISTADQVQDFQPSALFAKIRKCKEFEEDTDLKLKLVKQSSIPVYDDIDAIQVAVKDRQNCDDFLLDIDDGIIRLEAYTKALDSEIKERIEVINVLEIGEQYYDTQKGEAKVVCNAYRNFGSRIKALKKKLEELIPSLLSPVPSPDIDAPSPSSGSDLEMPEEESKEPVRYDSEKSFIGTDFVTAMNAASEKQSEYIRQMQLQQQSQQYDQNIQMLYGVQNSQENFDNHTSKETRAPQLGFYKGNPIEVINSSQTDSQDFDENTVGRSFLQNIITNPPPTLTNPSSSQSKIPGLESPTDARDIFNFIESKGKLDKDSNALPWIEKPVTKYQSWPSPDLTWNNSQETPVSPPAFEQESYANPVEYVDTNVDTFPSPFRDDHQSTDVDHRIFNASSKTMHSSHDYNAINSLSLPKHDVDSRCLPAHNVVANRNNLIPLTNSPSVNDTWKLTDSDYRTIPMPPTPPIILDTQSESSGRTSKTPVDNIESVDMEMSDEEEGRHEERNRPRRPSVKDEDEDSQKDHQSQLLPPPNPWDMVSVSHLDNDEDGADGRKNELSFHKIMPPNFIGNAQIMTMEPPRLPMHDFSRFPPPTTSAMAPRPVGSAPPPAPPPSVPPSNGAINPMNFSQPPMMNLPTRGDTRMFRPRMNFSPTGSNYGQPFNNFMPYGDMSNRPPGRFPPASAPMNQSLMKNSFPQSFNDDRRPSYENANSGTQYPPVENDSRNYSKKTDEDGFRKNSVSNIEPIIKSRQFDKRVSDSGTTFENANSNQPKSTGPRSNLKEISLSDVLEKSMNESHKNENDSSTNIDLSAVMNNDDLFGEDSFNNDNMADDGDDLYNNIEDSLIQSEEPRTIPDNVQNASANASGDCKLRQKTPFQATVPKLARLPMTPAATIDDDERNPWPIMPVIDLSDDNNGPGDGDYGKTSRSVENEGMNQFYNSPFSRRGSFPTDSRSRFQRGGPRFLSGGGDRNFSNATQTSSPRRGDMAFRRGGRFPSPRNEFRMRGSPSMFGTSNQDQMRGSMRPPYNRPPDLGSRGNFQNSPRMFPQRPQRMFRRGW